MTSHRMANEDDSWELVLRKATIYLKNIYHLLSTYVTGTMVRAFHTLFHSILKHNSNTYLHFSGEEMELIR